MKKSKIAGAVFAVIIAAAALAGAEEFRVNFNGKIAAQSIEGAVIQPADARFQTQPIVPPPQPQIFTKEAKPRPLSDLIGKCPRENQTEFYKSLVFVNIKLASVNIESIKECANSNEITALLYTPGRPWLKNTSCTCRFPPNMSSYLMCYKTPPYKCDTASCNGSCNDDSSKFAAGYLNMADIFLKVPEDAAREFAGSLILNEGKVGGYYYGGISRHLGTDEIKTVLGHLTGN